MKKTPPLLWILIGAAAGLCNGFFGSAGGSIILYFCLKRGITHDEAAATAIASTLLFTIASLVVYARLQAVDTALLWYVVPSMAIGGAVGAWAVGKLKSRLLSWLMAASLMASGIIMLIT